MQSLFYFIFFLMAMWWWELGRLLVYMQPRKSKVVILASCTLQEMWSHSKLKSTSYCLKSIEILPKYAQIKSSKFHHSTATIKWSNCKFQNLQENRSVLFCFPNITTCVTNRCIHLEIYDMNRSLFPFIHCYQPFGLVILQFTWFLVNSFDCIQGNLKKYLK